MHSPYMFAVAHLPVPKRVAAARNRIVRRLAGPESWYVAVRLPDGPRAWAEIPARGAPFDTDKANEIMDAWKTAGVA